MKRARLSSHRGSSLVFLGFSVVLFIITYGIMFILTAMILGTFWTAAGNVNIASADWQTIYDDTETQVQFLVPLMPTVGIFIFVIKVIMVSAVRGRD